VSRLLDQRGVPHEVLNAKQHFREAEIVAQAGRLGSVTVATNMAAVASTSSWAATRAARRP